MPSKPIHIIATSFFDPCPGYQFFLPLYRLSGYQVQFIRSSLSGYPLRPRSESGQCGGGRQPPFCLQPLIFYLRQNRPCLCTIPIGKAQPCESKRRRIKTHQLGVRTALVSRYFPRQLDVGSLVVTSRLPSPPLLALPAIREPW